MTFLNYSVCRTIALVLCSTWLMPSNPLLAQQTKLISDDFSSETHETRKAGRGDWKLEEGMLSVTQDDKLYKKYKNHGPIINYNVSHQDATAIIEFKPDGCKVVVFTMDAEDGGHAFRVKLRSAPKDQKGSSSKAGSDAKADSKGKGKGKNKGKGKWKSPASQILTYAAKVGDAKAEQITLSQDFPKAVKGEWNRLEVTVAGEKATVKLGDQTVEVEHPRIARKKKGVKIGFSFGKFAIRKFELTQ